MSDQRAGVNEHDWPQLAALLDCIEQATHPDMGMHKGALWLTYAWDVEHERWEWEAEVGVGDRNRNIAVTHPALLPVIEKAYQYVVNGELLEDDDA